MRWTNLLLYLVYPNVGNDWLYRRTQEKHKEHKTHAFTRQTTYRTIKSNSAAVDWKSSRKPKSIYQTPITNSLSTQIGTKIIKCTIFHNCSYFLIILNFPALKNPKLKENPQDLLLTFVKRRNSMLSRGITC